MFTIKPIPQTLPAQHIAMSTPALPNISHTTYKCSSHRKSKESYWGKAHKLSQCLWNSTPYILWWSEIQLLENIFLITCLQQEQICFT